VTATREHRNAGLIDDKINDAQIALEEAADLLVELSAFLPDDYPYGSVVVAHEDATKAVAKLAEMAH
jgi:hypothetical protein